MTATAKKWILSRAFDGEPKLSDFALLEEQVSLDLHPGEILLEAVYLSVDPYMRLDAKAEETVLGEQIAKVIASKNNAFPVGTLVVSFVGWRTLTVVSPEKISLFGPIARRIPEFGDLPASLGLGCVGMPGLTAYFGLLKRGQPNTGETILVNAASGAVGSVVGQIAKIKGCRVIGSAGSEEKCKWLEEIGFDYAFNYKTKTIHDALQTAAPNGVDLYFDNVGGSFTYEVIKNHMKLGGRVVVCGTISNYNNDDPIERSWYFSVISKQLTILGVDVSNYTQDYPECLDQLLQWVKEGKLKFKETVKEGFENMPEAFLQIFKGHNFGKTIVKV